MNAVNEEERQKQIKRNIRVTGAVLWLIVAAIFFYMIAKYYWISK
jgi:cytochrome c-type biogenesis protein CcmH/NrfG